MTPEQIQELIDQLFSMGETMATEGFRIALRQVSVGVTLGVVWLLTAMVGLIVSYSVMRNIKAGDEVDGKIFVAALVGTISGLHILFNVGEVARKLLNPEWYAIKEIMGLLH